MTYGRNEVGAFPHEPGIYTLSGNTYPFKDAIKGFGGTWDAAKKVWRVSEEAIDFLVAACPSIKKMVKAIRDPYCCSNPEETVWVTEQELAEGKTNPTFCSRCDSQFRGSVKVRKA